MGFLTNLPLILGAIFAFGLIVFAHELGHFLTALYHKIPVEEFSMGMGPLLWHRDSKGIRYSLRLFPIGAFVRLVGDEDSSDGAAKEDYHSIPVGRRMAMTFAGPLFNFVLAVVLFSTIGIFSGVISEQPRIGAVRPEGIAYHAGLLEGDTFLSINGVPISTWSEAVRSINASPEQELVIVVSRGGQETEILATPERSDGDGLGRIGISAVVERFDFVNSIRHGFMQTGEAIGLFYYTIFGSIITREAPELIGVVGIIQVTGQVAQAGFANLMWFMGFISINLGVVNLLPVPPLDGARLLLMTIEKVRGKPMNPEREGVLHMVGYFCLISLIVLVTFGDIWRIIGPR